jgi:signal transduction histidine kinase
MRIVPKMAIAWTLAGSVIFGVYAVYLIRAERRELQVAVEREARLVGRTLRASIENALRDRQLEDVRDVLHELGIADHTVGVALYGAEGEPIDTGIRGGDGGVDAALWAAAAQQALRQRGTVLRFDPEHGLGRLLLALPLFSDDGLLLGCLVVDRPLDDVRHDLRATSRGVASSLIVFIIASTMLGVVLGTVYITRPLANMVAAMLRVRDGDLEVEIEPHGRDEVGQLSEQFNAMVADLRTARSRIEKETESRRRLQRSLQDADKLVTIGQLSASLAHEIGSPLQVLNGRARLLLARPHDADEVRRSCEILVSQTERIAKIVQQLLRVARQKPATVESIDAVAVVRAVLDLLEVEARRRGVSLSLRTPRAVPALRANADQLQQVALNLVRNALEATAPGGSVAVTLEPGGDGGDIVRMIVEDNGKGIAPENLPHIFDPFFTTHAGHGGSGLGLAVVKAIVTEHGGTIAVDSRPGRGSRFTLELPRRGAGGDGP